MGQMLSGLAAVAGVSAIALASPAQDYMLHCMGCHGASAEGVPGKVPPLAHTLVQFMRSAAGRSYVLRVPGASNSDADGCAIGRGPELDCRALRRRSAAGLGGRVHGAGSRGAPALPMASVQATRREVVKELAASGSAPSEDY